MTCSNTLTITSPNTFRSATLTPSSLAISASTTTTLLIGLTNPISSISFLTFTFSRDISLVFSYSASNQATTQKLLTSTAPNTFLIGDLTNSTSSFTSFFLSSFTFTNAPFGNFPLTITIQSSNSVANIYYPIDTITLSYTLTPSSIMSASVSALNTVINTITTYTFTFRSINNLVSNSKIVLTLPVEIVSSNISTCSCSVSSTCSFLNLTSLIININSFLVSPNTDYVITINNILNPTTTTPTSTFALATYYYNTSTPTDILSSSVTFTATPAILSSGSVSSSSLTVAANSTYTITFQNRNLLPSTSYIRLSFPLTSFVSSSSASLSSFKIGGVSITGCVMSVVSTMSFRFNNCILTNINALATI